MQSWASHLLRALRLALDVRVARASKTVATHVIRALERVCPISCLKLLLWPAAAVRSARDVARREELPPSLRRQVSRIRWIWILWAQRVKVHLTKLMILWPDHLATPRWQARCDTSALDELKELCARGPVVLVTLHFGPLALLRYCLRANGLPVAGLVERAASRRSPSRRYLDELSDAASGLDSVPHVFGLSQLREAVKFIENRGLLLIAIDGIQGHKELINGVDYSIPFATGPIRLAARAGGVVVPCLGVVHRAFGLRLHLGKPISIGSVEGTCADIMRELFPIIQMHPEQCERGLIRAFQRHVHAPLSISKPNTEYA